MEKEPKVYKVSFNDFGVIYVVAHSYKEAAALYEAWVETRPKLVEWHTTSIIQQQSGHPVLISPLTN